MPLIQRTARVTRATATTIDHITTDPILESTMLSGITKPKIFGHFPIYIILQNSCNNKKNYEKTKIAKTKFSYESIQNFKYLLQNINCYHFLPSNMPNEVYNTFLKIFSNLCNVAFPNTKIEIKRKC